MTPKRIRDIIFAVFFVLALMVPSIDMLFRIDPVPARSENRVRTKFPNWPRSIKELKSFWTSFDEFYADNFGFRNALIYLYGRVKLNIFGMSPTPDVLKGRDGWYYLQKQNNVELYRNLKPFTKEEVDHFLDLIEERQAWAKKNNMLYVFLVGPDSHSLNPEHLPDWATKVDEKSRWDQLLDAARARHLPLLDVRPALLEAKHTHQVSFQTDTHWNVYGGYVAYRELINYLRKLDPTIQKPIPLSDYTISRINNERGMDLARLAGLQDVMRENSENAVYTGPLQYTVTEREGLHFTTINPDGDDQIMACVCDSMAGNLFPHFARQFKKTRVLWGYAFDTEEIKKYKPTIIVQMIIERELLWDQIVNEPLRLTKPATAVTIPSANCEKALPKIASTKELPKAIDRNTIVSADLIAELSPVGITISGMGPLEGPYPQWNLPRVRWANKALVTIAFDGTHSLKAKKLLLSFRPQVVTSAAMVVKFNGKILKEYRLTQADQWTDDILSINPRKGNNVIVFTFPAASTPKDSLFMLFRTLALDR